MFKTGSCHWALAQPKPTLSYTHASNLQGSAVYVLGLQIWTTMPGSPFFTLSSLARLVLYSCLHGWMVTLIRRKTRGKEWRARHTRRLNSYQTLAFRICRLGSEFQHKILLRVRRWSQWQRRDGSASANCGLCYTQYGSNTAIARSCKQDLTSHTHSFFSSCINFMQDEPAPT